jgi:hypothetical protein
MGKTDGCKLEIGKICEGSPRFLDAKGITIATFVSNARVVELDDYFKSLNRNFMIFDMDPSVSGYNLNDETLHDALFGHITDENSFHLEEMSNKLIDDIKSSSDVKPMSGGTRNPTKESTLGEVRKKQVKNMSKSEQQELVDDILDKGLENLSDLDKEILEFISKKT